MEKCEHFTFYERLTKLKDDAGITFTKIDEDCGCQSKSWKDGKHLPRTEVLMRLADYFDVSVDYLLCREESAISDEEMSLIAKFRLLDSYQRESVMTLIDGSIAKNPVKKDSGILSK